MGAASAMIAVGPSMGVGQAQVTQDVNSLARFSGHCENLVLGDDDLSSQCDGVLLNTHYEDGRSGFTFVARDVTSATFSGPDHVAAGDEATVELDRVVFLSLHLKEATPVTLPATGSCVFSNPDIGRAKVTCTARTGRGGFRASFVSNGLPPKIERF
jgi:hypothetical protein